MYVDQRAYLITSVLVFAKQPKLMVRSNRICSNNRQTTIQSKPALPPLLKAVRIRKNYDPKYKVVYITYKAETKYRSATRYEIKKCSPVQGSDQRNRTKEEEAVRVKRTHPTVAASLLSTPLFASENHFHSLRKTNDANRGDF